MAYVMNPVCLGNASNGQQVRAVWLSHFKDRILGAKMCRSETCLHACSDAPEHVALGTHLRKKGPKAKKRSAAAADLSLPAENGTPAPKTPGVALLRPSFYALACAGHAHRQATPSLYTSSKCSQRIIQAFLRCRPEEQTSPGECREY